MQAGGGGHDFRLRTPSSLARGGLVSGRAACIEQCPSSLSLVPLAQLRLLAGQEHGRTIPLADSPPHDLKHTICAVMRVLTATTLGILAFLASPKRRRRSCA